MNKLTAEQRVQKSHVSLMKDPKYCLYSGIFMVGKTEVSNDIPTACTDGRDTYYGREFVGKQNDKQLKGLILHENLHKAFRHTTTWQHLYKEHATLANMACDYVINLMIDDSDSIHANVQLPDGGLLDSKYRGMDAATVFRMLKKEAEGGSVNVKTIDNQQGVDVPVDEMGEEGFDDHDWEGAKDMGTEEKTALAQEIDQALRQGAILAGKLAGNVPREIGDLLHAQVDWR